MEQVYFGVYSLNNINVDVYLLPNESGGEFYFSPDKVSLPRIKIGLNFKDWDDVVAVAIHESMEFLLTQKGFRFRQSGRFTNDHADFTFIYNHADFTELCARQAFFLVSLIPKLANAFELKSDLKKLKRYAQKIVKEQQNAKS